MATTQLVVQDKGLKIFTILVRISWSGLLFWKVKIQGGGSNPSRYVAKLCMMPDDSQDTRRKDWQDLRSSLARSIQRDCFICSNRMISLVNRAQRQISACRQSSITHRFRSAVTPFPIGHVDGSVQSTYDSERPDRGSPTLAVRSRSSWSQSVAVGWPPAGPDELWLDKAGVWKRFQTGHIAEPRVTKRRYIPQTWADN